MGVYETTLDMLKKNSKILNVLRKAVEYEQKMSKTDLGWRWSDVKGSPALINRLVLEEIVTINYQSASTKQYLLTNLEETKKAIGDFLLVSEDDRGQGVLTGIPPDIFSTIIGYDDLKEMFMRSLRSQQPLHLLLVGSPATGKTLFLSDIMLLKGSRLCLGSSTKKAGLTRYLIDEKPLILLMDEIDKLDRDDTGALISLMETGWITETKTGRMTSVQLKTKVYGACNVDRNLPPELLSRFATFHLPDYTVDELRTVMERSLVIRHGCEEVVAKFIAEELIKVGSNDVRDAVRVWRFVSHVEKDKIKDEVLRVIQILKKYGGG